MITFGSNTHLGLALRAPLAKDTTAPAVGGADPGKAAPAAGTVEVSRASRRASASHTEGRRSPHAAPPAGAQPPTLSDPIVVSPLTPLKAQAPSNPVLISGPVVSGPLSGLPLDLTA